MDQEDQIKPGRVTIRTVAEDAGVSVAAVSKVLRNAYGVSDGLRSKVVQSIDRLGYRPSRAARGMRGRTYTIGVLLVDMVNPFIPEILAGAKSVLADAGYQALIGVSDARMQIEAGLIESMMSSHMDGLILVAPRLTGDLLEAFAVQIPIVVIGHHEKTATAFDTVNADDFGGAELVVRSLYSEGHRDIQMLSLNQQTFEKDVYRQREAGYLHAMEQLGLSGSARILGARMDRNYMEEDLRSILSVPKLPSAIFCWSDLHAVMLLNIAKTMGIRIPEDLAIVGFDNSPVAALPLIDLSTVDQSGRELGLQSAKALLSRIEGRPTAEHILLEPTLVRRSSS